MRKKSAGIMLYRFYNGALEILVCHPGGPYGKGHDHNGWSIPKGRIELDELEVHAAKRELYEETGIDESDYNDVRYLGVAKQSRKDVYVFSALYIKDGDPIIKSNVVDLEWPRGSGKIISVPEIDLGEFVSPVVAKYRLNRGQGDMVDILIDMLSNK